jgi:hypothetical protein
MSTPSLLEYALSYATSREMSTALDVLGEGTDGSVWLSSDRTAIKVFRMTEQFENEKECYLRLLAEQVTEVRGFAIPKLINYDNRLRVIEMSTVKAPYILDFGKCYLDRKPEFSAEVWGDLYSQIREIYDDRYDEVMSAVRSLQQYGIFYYDVKPKNVLPANWDPIL